MPEIVKNELHPDLLAAAALNPFAAHNSSSRAAMFTSHIGQSLVIEGAEPRRNMTGVEREYGKYTFSISMPCDAQIIRIVERYPSNMSKGSIKQNPETVVVYENIQTKEVGVLFLKRTHSLDKKFGFTYNYKNTVHKLAPKAFIPKGTILADTPSVDDQQNYCYGIEANTAFMSIPQVIEDGVVVRKGFLEKLRTNGYENRVVSWGKKKYPLNLYGDKENYKPFPDIGDRIRDDGLLFALRSYDELLAPVEMTPEKVMEPDFFYDTLVYAEPGAVVTDVITHHDLNATYKPTPVGMTECTDKYRRANTLFYSTILDEYKSLKRRRGEALVITPEFQRLLTECLSDSAKTLGNKDRVVRTFKREAIDDWRVEVKYTYKITPTEGFKITDSHGQRVTDWSC